MTPVKIAWVVPPFGSQKESPDEASVLVRYFGIGEDQRSGKWIDFLLLVSMSFVPYGFAGFFR